MARYTDFASPGGSLRQFALSAAKAAIRLSGRGISPSFRVNAKGEAETSYDPAWLLREDIAYAAGDRCGFVAWEPDTDSITGGTAVMLVTEVYDLAGRSGLQLKTPMTADRKNPLVRRIARGQQVITDIPVPDADDPRYRNWDLRRFVHYSEHELVRHAKTVRATAVYTADSRTPAQKYAELAEYAGFAYVDSARMLRYAASRTGRYWHGKAMSIEWRPGEDGAREQLAVSLSRQTTDGGAPPALAATWWTDVGVVHTRLTDGTTGVALQGGWRITPVGGLSGLFGKVMQLGDNTVVRISPNVPVDSQSDRAS